MQQTKLRQRDIFELRDRAQRDDLRNRVEKNDPLWLNPWVTALRENAARTKKER
jgi:hypothetical protein